MQTNDLFPGQRRPAALDELERPVCLVRAVHVDVDPVDRIEVVHGNAVAAQTLCRCFRAGHGRVNPGANFRQRIDEMIGR